MLWERAGETFAEEFLAWLSIAVEPFSFPKDVKHEKIHECCSTGVTRSPHHFIVQDLEQQPTVITALRSCQRWDSRANHPWITSFGSSHGWVYSSHGAVWIRSTLQCVQLVFQFSEWLWIVIYLKYSLIFSYFFKKVQCFFLRLLLQKMKKGSWII